MTNYPFIQIVTRKVLLNVYTHKNHVTCHINRKKTQINVFNVMMSLQLFMTPSSDCMTRAGLQ